MESQTRIKDNWLTQKINDRAYLGALMVSLVLVTLGYFYLNDILNADQWMPANKNNVFTEKEFWRLWTTLFAHGDLSHLMSNLMLFIPLSFILIAHYGLLIFPVASFVMGGLINMIVLQNMPDFTYLIGISGLVYWMGAVWMTLFIQIDRRKTLRRRLALALFLTVILFIPETYQKDVSYLSHFIGYVLGVLSGLAYYQYSKQKFEAAVVIETIVEDEAEPEAKPEVELTPLK